MQEQILKPSVSVLLGKKPLIIAGPCSAETEEQVLETAVGLKNTGYVDILRAGIWKPRTRPGNFEGVGSIGLPWLMQASKQTGLPVAVEVANAAQVEEALKHGVDLLWIGARTTVNPFSVQELANVLRGVDTPVLIKNPVNADVDLWTGALERLQEVGLPQVGLVHRGFSSYGNTEFRNAPMWHLAIEMKRRFPGIPFLIDPSHICGNREMLQEVTQHAMDLDYDGVMIESHRAPDMAWSDAAQQITPESLKQLLDHIVWRAEKIVSEELHAKLEKLRQQINQLDEELLYLLSDRMKLAEQIGAYKKENNITILQTARWNEVLDRVCKNGTRLGLSRDFIRQYFDAIHLESIKHQDMIMNKQEP
jgi:chorismate mutase